MLEAERPVMPLLVQSRQVEVVFLPLNLPRSDAALAGGGVLNYLAIS
jgi:hypothetical protein